jgi:hypothetical protein
VAQITPLIPSEVSKLRRMMETKTISEKAGEEFEQTLKLMDSSVKLLSITGIIPSKEICSSLLKYRIYRLCQVLSYTLYGTVLLLQVLGLYHYWEDLVITTDNMAVILTFMIGYSATIFTIRDSREICDLIDYLEKRSILSFRKIRSNTRHMKIIKEAKNVVSRLTWFAAVSLLITTFFWTVYPLVLLMFRRETEGKVSQEGLRPTFQYLVFVMFIPSDGQDSYLYGAIYLLQAIVFSTALTYLIGLISLYVSLIVYTTAQFKIVSEAINEIDNTMSYKQEKERVADFTEINAGPDGTFNLFMPPRTLLFDEQCQCENESRRVAVHSIALEKGHATQRHATSVQIASPEMSIHKPTNDAEADSAIFMMMECIKLHQSAIR